MDANTYATRTPGAIRAKRYRERKKDGIRCVRIRVSQAALKFLIDSGFLTAGPCQNADIERAIYGVFNAAKAAGVTRDGILPR